MTAARLLTVNDVARVLGTSAQAVRNALSRGLEGQTVPPSIRLGRRRVWLKATVYAWLRDKAKPASVNRAPSGVPQSQTSKEGVMSRTKFDVGDVLIDDGEELTVIEIDRERNEVVFEDEDGDEVVMDLADVRDALREGEIEKAA